MIKAGHKVNILLFTLVMFMVRCDPDVTMIYQIKNLTDSAYILNYSTDAFDDSTRRLEAQSTQAIYYVSWIGTDVMTYGDSLGSVIYYIKLFDEDSVLVYEQDPLVAEEWEYKEDQKSIFIVNTGGSGIYTFKLKESIF